MTNLLQRVLRITLLRFQDRNFNRPQHYKTRHVITTAEMSLQSWTPHYNFGTHITASNSYKIKNKKEHHKRNTYFKTELTLQTAQPIKNA